jgi:putative tryptophan/tyrosine transport system substrate-binding protein
MMRRDFIGLVGGAVAALPISAGAQRTERVRRVGVLISLPETDPEGQRRAASLVRGLKELGWTEGENLRIDYRWEFGGHPDRMRLYSAELLALKPEVIVTNNILMVQTLRHDSTSVPIVMVNVANPVEAGLVASLARPAGRTTGFAAGFTGEKWVQLLKEIAPTTKRILVFRDNSNPVVETVLSTAAALQVQATGVHATEAIDFERSIEFLAKEPDGGFIVIPSGPSRLHRELIISLAARHRLPAIYGLRNFVLEGGLLSYGIDTADLYYRTALYVHLILSGTDPADLPVQRPTKFECVINLKTAKALGLAVPNTLLAIADDVIE